MFCMIANQKGGKAQSAMEYLMTYGWAILIIAVVLGALFQLGVFNSSSFSPRAPPGACQVFRPSGPGTTTNINLMGVCTGQLPQYVAQFNGQGYITAGSGTVLNPGSGSFSIKFWFKTSTAGANMYPVNKGNVGQALPTVGYSFYMGTGGGMALYMNDNSGAGAAGIGTGRVYNDGKWHDIVGVIDRTANKLRLYLDGGAEVPNPVDISAYGAINPTADSLHIGAYDTPGATFIGSMSNVQIYNASLSANQIQALYLEGMGGAPMLLQNIVGWWPLNGNSNDYSGNNNNGAPTALTFTSQYGK